jgi:hypothetical protein
MGMADDTFSNQMSLEFITIIIEPYVLTHPTTSALLHAIIAKAADFQCVP